VRPWARPFGFCPSLGGVQEVGHVHTTYRATADPLESAFSQIPVWIQSRAGVRALQGCEVQMCSRACAREGDHSQYSCICAIRPSRAEVLKMISCRVDRTSAPRRTRWIWIAEVWYAHGKIGAPSCLATRSRGMGEPLPAPARADGPRPGDCGGEGGGEGGG
jgi:hypothetical protein